MSVPFSFKANIGDLSDERIYLCEMFWRCSCYPDPGALASHRFMFRHRNTLLIWVTDMIAGFCSRRFVSFLMSEPDQHSGAWPNFKTPRLLAADGNLAEAIQFAEIELEKEPENLEGLLLLASLHEDKGHPGKAIRYWRQVEQSPASTQAQKELAHATRQRLEKLV